MLSNFIRFYVYSNVHISLCALIFVMGSYKLSGVGFDIHYTLLVASSTLVSYNLHRMIGLSKASNRSKTERFRYLIDHQLAAGLIVLIGMAIMAYNVLFVDPSLLYVLSGLGIITGLYLLPILKNKKRLRDLPFIKIAAISIVWSGIFLLPLINNPNDRFSILFLVLIFIEKALFIFALTIPFDVRDILIDKEQSVKTIATAFQPKHLLRIIKWSLIICAIINIVLFSYSVTYFHVSLALIALYAAQYILSHRSIKETHELYYLGILDGIILVNGLVYFM